MTTRAPPTITNFATRVAPNGDVNIHLITAQLWVDYRFVLGPVTYPTQINLWDKREPKW